MKVRVTTKFFVAGAGDLDSQTNRVLQKLIKLESQNRELSEADVSAAIADRLVDLSIVVDAPSWTEAETTAEEIFVGVIRDTGGKAVLDADALPRAESDLLATIQSTELVPA